MSPEVALTENINDAIFQMLEYLDIFFAVSVDGALDDLLIYFPFRPRAASSVARKLHEFNFIIMLR